MTKKKNSGQIDFAWKVHGLLDTWTAKVDAKASISLAIEVAVFGFVISLSKEHGVLSNLTGAQLFMYVIGVGLLVISMLLAVFVVFPQLARFKSKKEWQKNMIYFGHLRHWDPVKLAKALPEDGLSKDQLARQLVTMSKIAWRKHVWLQCSLGALVSGSLLLLFAGIT